MYWPELTLSLLTGYKRYPGMIFSWTFLAGNNLTNFSISSLKSQWIIIIQLVYCFFAYATFFQTQMDHFVPMSVKNVSNMCSAKTCYINCLIHKKCNSVTTSSSTGQLNDYWAQILQSHVGNSHFWSCNSWFHCHSSVQYSLNHSKVVLACLWTVWILMKQDWMR